MATSNHTIVMRDRQVAWVLRSTAVAAALAIAGTALAQQIPQAGDVMRETNRPAPQLPKSDPSLPKAQEVRPAMQVPGGFKVMVNGFRVTGNKSIKETDLQLLLTENLGKENNFAELQRAADAVSNFYRAQGFFVARAYLPRQEIQGGIVEIAVLEGNVGAAQVKQAANARTKAQVFQGILDANVPAGTVVHEATLERAALLANDLPGVAASVSLDPGANTGDTNVTLETSEGRPIVLTVDTDNYGNRYTGTARLGATVYINSPLGLGDQLSVRGSTTAGGLVKFGRLSYQLPVGSNGLRVGAAYSQSVFEVCCQAGINPEGEGTVASVFTTYPVVRGRNLSVYLNGTYDAKTSINKPGVGASRKRTDDVLSVGASVESRDNFGGGGANFLNLNYSTGNIGIEDPTDQTADATGPQAAGRFNKLGLQASRTQRLSDRFSLYTGLNSQPWASKNLDGGEKFGLGGPQGVRAYPGGEGTGDTGHVVQVELRADLPFDLFGSLWQGVLFTDYGNVTVNRNQYVVGGLTPNSYTLKGWGLGLNVTRAGLFQIRTFVATKIGDNPAPGTTGNDADGRKQNTRLWFQAVTQF